MQGNGNGPLQAWLSPSEDLQ